MDFESAMDALKRFGESVAEGMASLMDAMKQAAQTLMDFFHDLRTHLVRELLPGTGFTVCRGEVCYQGTPINRRKARLRKKLNRKTDVLLFACLDAATA